MPTIDNVVDNFLDRLEHLLNQNSDSFEDFRALVDDIIADFRNN